MFDTLLRLTSSRGLLGDFQLVPGTDDVTGFRFRGQRVSGDGFGTGPFISAHGIRFGLRRLLNNGIGSSRQSGALGKI